MLPVSELLLSGFVFAAFGQQKPAVPISETTYKAGQSFSVDLQLPEPAPDPVGASVPYTIVGVPANATGFDCMGSADRGVTHVSVFCSTTYKNKAGEYRAGEVTLFTVGPPTENSVSKKVDVRMPIITLTATDPPAPLRLPSNVLGASLIYDRQHSLEDGADKTEVLRDDFSAHFPREVADTRENRTYLIGMVDYEKTIIAASRRHYSSTMGPLDTLPPMFDDFEQRLDAVTRHLGGTPKAHAELVAPQMRPHIILASAQRPSVTDSTNVTEQPGNLSHDYDNFVVILGDVIEGFRFIAQSGNDKFTWSITTDVPNADVYYSKIGTPERQWAGHTDLKNQELDYAIWTFRVDWNGCSKSQTPDPYHQHIIPMAFQRAGCTKP